MKATCEINTQKLNLLNYIFTTQCVKSYRKFNTLDGEMTVISMWHKPNIFISELHVISQQDLLQGFMEHKVIKSQHKTLNTV